jgi:cell wall-associated NlpC family hydrolase
VLGRGAAREPNGVRHAQRPLAFAVVRLHRYAPTALGSLLAVALLAGCGDATSGQGPATDPAQSATASASAGARVSAKDAGATAKDRGAHAKDPRTQAQDPGAAAAVAGPTAVTGTPGIVREVADPEEARSFPVHGPVHHVAAATPAVSGEVAVAQGAASDAEVSQELAQMHAAAHAATTPSTGTAALPANDKQLLTPVPGGESVGGNGTIPIPTDVPPVVQKVIAGANEIADFPYVYGGGHASFVDDAYDCSGSVSYALAAGGLLSAPETSGQLESWGVPGPGRYITVYANAGHTYMYVDGILFDTAGRSGPYTSRWQVAPTDNEGYVVRHWPGL